MEIVELVRIVTGPERTMGVLILGAEPFAMTIEPRAFDNLEGASCIPASTYICKMSLSKRFGKVYKVQNVPCRTGILIHPGNSVDETAGCILMGSLNPESPRCVWRSKKTLELFTGRLQEKDFILKIRQL